MADIKEQRTIILSECSKVTKEVIVQLDNLFEYSSPEQYPVVYYSTGNSKQHHNERNCK